MLFSVLVANYNNGQFFKDCYNAIIAQTYTNWEVIIVDDCSTDDSVNIIQELTGNDKRFRLFLNEKNFGCGYTKRRCAELANGEISGYVDPDDTLTPEALELMMQAHKDNPAVALVHSKFYYCNELLERTSIFERAKNVLINDHFVNLDAGVTALATFKMAFYKLTSGIDPTLLRAVDQDLYLKLSETGQFYFLDKPLYNYRIHHKGISTSKADHALYWYLKVIMKTEERRKVNLEDEVAVLLNRTNPENLEINLANPRYLVLAMIKTFKKRPESFFKKLFVNRY